MWMGYPSTRSRRHSDGDSIRRKSTPKKVVIGKYDEDHNSSSARRPSNLDDSPELWLTRAQNQGVALPTGPAERRYGVPGAAS